MTKKTPTPNETAAMTAETIGRDLLQALVLEIKMAPKPWVKMTESAQAALIDRLSKRVAANVQTAVHLIASQGRQCVAAVLDQITVKDGIKAVLIMSKHDPQRHSLMDAQGKAVLVAIADPEDHMGEIGEVRPDPDQSSILDSAQAYTDDDGAGMDGDKGADATDAVILALTDAPLDADLKAAYQDGRQAARDGKGINDTPAGMRHELVAKWTAGWRDETDGVVDPDIL